MDTEESLKRAAEIQAEQDAAEDAQKPSETASFDEFWADVERNAEPRPTETIRGVTVYVPTPRQKTMRLGRQIDRFQDQDLDEGEQRQLLADIFGVDVLEKWVDSGMTDEQFGVVIAWALSRLGGREITWQQAYDLVTKGVSEGKAQPQSGSRPGSKPPSGGTGGQSKGGSRRRGGRRKK